MKRVVSAALTCAVLTCEAPARADDAKVGAIALTSFCYGLGFVPAVSFYAFDKPAPGAVPFWIFHAGLAPSIPRATMRDWVGTAIFTSLRAGPIVLAEARWRKVESSHGTHPAGEFYAFGILLPVLL